MKKWNTFEAGGRNKFHSRSFCYTWHGSKFFKCRKNENYFLIQTIFGQQLKESFVGILWTDKAEQYYQTIKMILTCDLWWKLLNCFLALSVSRRLKDSWRLQYFFPRIRFSDVSIQLRWINHFQLLPFFLTFLLNIFLKSFKNMLHSLFHYFWKYLFCIFLNVIEMSWITTEKNLECVKHAPSAIS